MEVMGESQEPVTNLERSNAFTYSGRFTRLVNQSQKSDIELHKLRGGRAPQLWS